MKNDQKNPIQPSVPFSCMLGQLMTIVQDNSIKWHLRNHIWSLNLNPWFKPTSFNLVARCISPKHIILPCHDHASYCRICIDCVLLYCRCLSPFSRRCSDDVIDDTDEELFLSSEVSRKKNPLVHSDTIPLSRSCSLLMHQDNNDSTIT